MTLIILNFLLYIIFSSSQSCISFFLFVISVEILNRLGFVDSSDVISSVRTAIEETSLSPNVLPPYNSNSDELQEEKRRKEYVQKRTYEELEEEVKGLNNAGKKKVKRRSTHRVTGEYHGIHGPPGDYSK